MNVHTIAPNVALLCRLVVYGVPGPQGSKRHVGGGRMIESSKKVKPWREAVKYAALEAKDGAGPLDGPIACSMVFTLAKPASRPKGRRTWATGKPDLSKLLRSTEDALTDAGLWKDDARVVEYLRAAKVFPGEDPDALDTPGCVITVWAIIPGDGGTSTETRAARRGTVRTAL